MIITETSSGEIVACCRACGAAATPRWGIEVGLPFDKELCLDECKACGSFSFRGEDCVIGYADGLSEGSFWQHYVQSGAGISAMLQPLLAVPKRGDLLDVGCGFGFVVDFWNRIGCGHAIGLEKAAYGAIGAEKLGAPIFPVLLGEASEVDERRYDIVFSSEVIEHTPDPTLFVRALLAPLADDGILVLTTPSAEAVIQNENPAARFAALSPLFHYLVFSKSSLEQLLRCEGLPHVKVCDEGGRLFAWASRSPLPELAMDRFPWDQYLDYLALLSRSACPHVRSGALYRLFKDAWNTGRRDLGRRTFLEFERFVGEEFELELRNPDISPFLQRRSILTDLTRCPSWLGPTLVFGSIIVWETEADAACRRAMLEAAVEVMRHETSSEALVQFAQEASAFLPFAERELERVLEETAGGERSAGKAARPSIAICTLVTDWDDFKGLKESLAANGFTEPACEFHTIDNSKTQTADGFEAIRRFLVESTSEWVLIVHQDVRMLLPFETLIERVREVEKLDPQWAVLGNAGKTSRNSLSGPIAIRNSRRDFHTGPFPAQVEALDENFLLIRRDCGVQPTGGLAGFHFYGLDICQAAKRAGLRSYAIDYLCFHRSDGKLDQAFYDSQDAFEQEYGRCFKAGMVATTCTVVGWGLPSWRMAFCRALGFAIVSHSAANHAAVELSWKRGVKESPLFPLFAAAIILRLKLNRKQLMRHLQWWCANFSFQRFFSALARHCRVDRSPH